MCDYDMTTACRVARGIRNTNGLRLETMEFLPYPLPSGNLCDHTMLGRGSLVDMMI